MSALALAKRRARRRHLEGGAVMFIVAMTMAVLASVGIYALVAATTEVKMSGNERQSTQTHYLSEYGVLGTAEQLQGTIADFYLGIMANKPDTCASLAAVPSTAPTLSLECVRIYASDFSKHWNQAVPVTVPYQGTVPYAPNFAPGSFGPTPMTGDFFVEVNERTQVPAQGYSGKCAELLTVTSYGITQPSYPLIAASSTAVFGGEGVEVQRARIKAAPVNCLH